MINGNKRLNEPCEYPGTPDFNRGLKARIPGGYTLVEIMVAFGVFTLFLASALMLFRSGQNAGNQSYWLQKTATQLRNTVHHLSLTMQKSSSPTTIVFPGKIIESARNEFKVHISSRELVQASEAMEETQRNIPCTQFLRVTESLPERKNFEINNPASLTYHIYSLTKTGKILYHRYIESVSTIEPLFIEGVKRTRIPPEEATLAEARVLVDDVESVKIQLQRQVSRSTPVSIEITCANPRGKTRRAETFTGIPNVEVISHPFDPDW